MGKKQDEAAAKADALSVAERCEKQAIECGEAFAKMGELFAEGAKMIRTLHAALSQVECQHLITTKVTKEMIDSGRESRSVGKYCMTCGAHIDAKPSADTGEQG